MPDNLFGFMPVTRDEFEAMKEVVKELIEINKKQSEHAMTLQKQINLIQKEIELLRKLV